MNSKSPRSNNAGTADGRPDDLGSESALEHAADCRKAPHKKAPHRLGRKKDQEGKASPNDRNRHRKNELSEQGKHRWSLPLLASRHGLTDKPANLQSP